MFFVVYFVAAAIHKVVPHTWINGISDHLEKFINNGLNRNQKFTVFYTNSIEAFDENSMPKADFLPNFNVSRHRVFPNEGLYLGQLTSFRSKLRSS